MTAPTIRIVDVDALRLPLKGDAADWAPGRTVADLEGLRLLEPEDMTPAPSAEAEAAGDDGKGKPKRQKAPDKRDLLIDLATRAYELWHDGDGKGYATARKGPPATWAIRSGFRGELLRAFYVERGDTVGRSTADEVLDLLEARAVVEGAIYTPAVRVGGDDTCVYLDLGDPTRRAAEVDAEGWRVVENPAIRFVRPKGIQALPVPVRGGTLEPLWRVINVREADRPLVVGWLVGALRAGGPYPVLVLSGEAGSAKTWTARILRRALDPSKVDTATMPKEEADLGIAGGNSWVVSLDNLPSLTVWLSDALCRLATGAGFRKRQLYTDDNEILINVCRPAILNGIERVAERGDLVDRSILLDLPRIRPEDRRPERLLLADFGKALPGILGALLDAVSTAIRRLPEVQASGLVLPRLADFAEWVTAAEPALPWEPGAFMRAYTDAQAGALEAAIEGDAVADAVRRAGLDAGPEGWTGTHSELYKAVLPDLGNLPIKARPGNARALSARVRRLAGPLRAVGVEVHFHDSVRPKTLTLRRAATPEPREGGETCDACDAATEPAPRAVPRPVATALPCDGADPTYDTATRALSQTTALRRDPSQPTTSPATVLEAAPVATVAPVAKAPALCADEVPPVEAYSNERAGDEPEAPNVAAISDDWPDAPAADAWDLFSATACGVTGAPMPADVPAVLNTLRERGDTWTALIGRIGRYARRPERIVTDWNAVVTGEADV